MHDRLAAYLSFDYYDNPLWRSNLLRELTFVIGSNGYAWARNIALLYTNNRAERDLRMVKVK
jgi:transposase